MNNFAPPANKEPDAGLRRVAKIAKTKEETIAQVEGIFVSSYEQGGERTLVGTLVAQCPRTPTLAC